MAETNRRAFLKALAGAGVTAVWSPAQEPTPADFELRIEPVEVEIAPRHWIKTTGYNGGFPGPVLRMTEGKPVAIDVENNTSLPELVHWHGLFIPSEIDGAAEEGTPMLLPKARQRYNFIPDPAGTRWYHSHTFAGRNFNRSTYTGQFGFLLIEGKQNPGRYDQEVLLALHGWDPFLSSMGEGMDDESVELRYKKFTVNSHALGMGEPIRVKQGQRVLFRLLNANATRTHRLCLPGHSFTVVALDGNPVPVQATVSVLELAPAERIDAVVEMKRPGVWMLADPDRRVRNAGLGIVIEYAGSTGAPQWQDPPKSTWDYTIFGSSAVAPAPPPERRLPLVFRAKFAGKRSIDHWTINGKEYAKSDPIQVRTNERYALLFDNQSDDDHPIHLHRHSFELIKTADKSTAGVMKDVVVVPAHKQVEVYMTANHPGPSLLHCHMQLHMDFGFMALLQYEDQPGRPLTPMSH